MTKFNADHQHPPHNNHPTLDNHQQTSCPATHDGDTDQSIHTPNSSNPYPCTILTERLTGRAGCARGRDIFSAVITPFSWRSRANHACNEDVSPRPGPADQRSGSVTKFNADHQHPPPITQHTLTIPRQSIREPEVQQRTQV